MISRRSGQSEAHMPLDSIPEGELIICVGLKWRSSAVLTILAFG